MQNLKVCWFSAGVSSFIAGYLSRDTIDQYIYIDIADQHPDSIRFIRDCEKFLRKSVQIITSSEYHSVDDACRGFNFICSPQGARCTMVLKKRVRKQWEDAHKNFNITYVWGMDVDEKERAFRIEETMPYFCHEFPLIDHRITKKEAHGICKGLGIDIPEMYRIGYDNNNCIGCVKGGKGYWNKIRKDFPDVFEKRAKLERDIGHSILHDKNGMIFLDELDPDAGRNVKEIMPECGIACEIILKGEEYND